MNGWIVDNLLGLGGGIAAAALAWGNLRARLDAHGEDVAEMKAKLASLDHRQRNTEQAVAAIGPELRALAQGQSAMREDLREFREEVREGFRKERT